MNPKAKQGYVILMHERVEGKFNIHDPLNKTAQTFDRRLRKMRRIRTNETIAIIIWDLDVLRTYTPNIYVSTAQEEETDYNLEPIEISLVTAGDAEKWGLRLMDRVTATPNANAGFNTYTINSVFGITNPEESRKRPTFERFRKQKNFPSERIPIERIGELAANPPDDMDLAKIRDIKNGGSTLMKILSYMAPLLYGSLLMATGQFKSGKSFAMEMVLYVARWILLKEDPNMEIIYCSLGERGGELGAILKVAQSHERITFVGTSMDDVPTEKWVIATFLAMELLKRFVELGKKVIFFGDSLTRYAEGVSLSGGEKQTRTSGGHVLSALVEPRKMLGLAGVYPNHPWAIAGTNDIPTVTVMVTALRDSGGAWHDVPADVMNGTSDADWTFDSRIEEHPKLMFDGGRTSTRRMSSVNLSEPELWFMNRLRNAVLSQAKDTNKRNRNGFDWVKASRYLRHMFGGQRSVKFYIEKWWNEKLVEDLARLIREDERVSNDVNERKLAELCIYNLHLNGEEIEKLIEEEVIGELVELVNKEAHIHDFLTDRITKDELFEPIRQYQLDWSKEAYMAALDAKTLSALTVKDLVAGGVTAPVLATLIEEGYQLSDVRDVGKRESGVKEVSWMRKHLPKLRKKK